MALRRFVMTAAPRAALAPRRRRTSVARACNLSSTTGCGRAVHQIGWFYIGANGDRLGRSQRKFRRRDRLGGDTKGPFAGGQIGFNYRTGMIVFGVEVDGQRANIKESYQVLA